MKYKIEIDTEASFERVKGLLLDNFQKFKIEDEEGKEYKLEPALHGNAL